MSPGPSVGPVPGFRCAVASADLGEPLAGTASTVRAFLVLEVDGPWGRDAVADSRLDSDVRAVLGEMEGSSGVRPLLMRRHGRRSDAGARLFAAYVDRRQPWLETTLLADHREVLDLPLDELGRGSSVGLTRWDRPVFLVCTHGRHDACCAESGRPLAEAMSTVAPEDVWEVSHIGGDRFAANVLVLPHGLYYGRLTPADARPFVATHLAGRLDLQHLRGRSTYPFAVQAAEVELRRHLGLDDAAPLVLAERRREGDRTRVVLLVGATRWEVEVRSRRDEPRQLTCRAVSPGRGLRQEVVSLVRAD